MTIPSKDTVSTSHDSASTPSPVSFWIAFLYWLKLGFISFGGPAGQISMMHQELVEKRRWISERRFLHALNYTMVLPGPEAQQLATYIGWLLFGVWGGVVAGVLFVLPSLVLLILLTWVYLSYGDVPVIAGVLYGIKPAVTAIVLFAAWRIGKRALNNAFLISLAFASFVAIFVFNVPFPYIVLAACLIGFVGSKFWPQYFVAKGHASLGASSTAWALIDDDTPIPEHARFSWRRFVIFLCVGVGLWLLAISLLAYYFGWQSPLSQMAWFFSKAALVTFGGAYAVLPYVYQGGVEQYGWLTATQMIDGLALGETTPGPLIMVVAFVGFVGGWTTAFLGVDSLLLAGVAGALVVTFFTFLPSFLFILLGGPAVEATRGELSFTAPLTAVTAAVVGVILNLAVFFAYPVLWPSGIDGALDFISLGICGLVFLALFKWQMNIMVVIALSGLSGLVISLI